MNVVLIRCRRLNLLQWASIPLQTTSPRFPFVLPRSHLTSRPSFLLVDTSLLLVILIVADIVELGLGVAKLGRSSITWRVGVFIKTEGKTQRPPEDPLACAVIDFTHVYCEPVKRRPIEIPKNVRESLERILLPEEGVPAKL